MNQPVIFAKRYTGTSPVDLVSDLPDATAVLGIVSAVDAVSLFYENGSSDIVMGFANVITGTTYVPQIYFPFPLPMKLGGLNMTTTGTGSAPAYTVIYTTQDGLNSA